MNLTNHSSRRQIKSTFEAPDIQNNFLAVDIDNNQIGYKNILELNQCTEMDPAYQLLLACDTFVDEQSNQMVSLYQRVKN